MENYAIRDILLIVIKYQVMEWPVGGTLTLCEQLFEELY